MVCNIKIFKDRLLEMIIMSIVVTYRTRIIMIHNIIGGVRACVFVFMCVCVGGGVYVCTYIYIHGWMVRWMDVFVPIVYPL